MAARPGAGSLGPTFSLSSASRDRDSEYKWSFLLELGGQSASVTGASAGLGAAMAIALAETGTEEISQGNLRSPQHTCQQVEKLGRSTSGIHADLSKPWAAQHLFVEAQQIAPVDIVVNNAGIIHRAKAGNYNHQHWMAGLQVNLNSLWKLWQAADRIFLSRGSGGKIINVASLLAFQGGISVPAHPASKGAVVQLTKALANEWAAQGVNVNAITPGLCAPTTPPRCNAMKFAIVRFSTASRSAMGRTERYLWSGGVSCLGNYIHGHVLVVDGGGWADSGRADDAIFLEASVTCSKVYLSSNLVCFNSRNGRCTGGCS